MLSGLSCLPDTNWYGQKDPSLYG